MEWRKPQLIRYETEKLMCKIKARAESLGPSCTMTYAEDHACPELDATETWCRNDSESESEGGGGICGVLTFCVEIGPLFGCDHDLACGSITYVLR